jgi:hypothetical protein
MALNITESQAAQDVISWFLGDRNITRTRLVAGLARLADSSSKTLAAGKNGTDVQAAMANRQLVGPTNPPGAGG